MKKYLAKALAEVKHNGKSIKADMGGEIENPSEAAEMLTTLIDWCNKSGDEIVGITVVVIPKKEEVTKHD